MTRGAFEPKVQNVAKRVAGTPTPTLWGSITGDPYNQTDMTSLFLENGFDNQTDSTIAFVDGTRTFSITPTGASFSFNSGNLRFTKVAVDSVVATNVEGLHYFYYDNSGVLIHTTTFTEAIITDYAFVALVYWDATNEKAIAIADERHGNIMDSATHLYHHSTQGTSYASGLTPGDLDVDGSGNDASAAQLSVTSGVIWDEDLKFTIPVAPVTTAIPIFYKDGASGAWRRIEGDGYIGTTAGLGGRAVYNNPDAGGAGVWGLTEITNKDFYLMHLFATDDIDDGFFWFMGQEEYGSKGVAREGALTELLSMNVDGMPTVEYKSVASFIMQTDTNYTNTPKSKLVSTDTGDSYVDWRAINTGVAVSIAGAVSTTWGDILGTLSDQADLQLELDNRAVLDAGNVFTGVNIFGTTGITATLDTGAVVVATGLSGLLTPISYADDFIVEGSGDTGISILSTDAGYTSIILGNASKSAAAGFAWNYDVTAFDEATTFALGTRVPTGQLILRSSSDIDRMKITSGGRVIIGDLTTPINPGMAGGVVISTGLSGRSNASSAADDLVIESNGDCGISILTPDADVARISFGSQSDKLAGTIQWNYSTRIMKIGGRATGAELQFEYDYGVTGFYLNATGQIIIGDETTPLISPKTGGVTISLGDSGMPLSELHSAADGLIIENNGDTGITIATPISGSAYIAFGDPGKGDAGSFHYYHPSGRMFFQCQGEMRIKVGGNIVTDMEPTLLRFFYDVIIDHGNTGTVFESVAENLVIEDTAECGMSIVTTATEFANLFFAKPNYERAGYVRYDMANDELHLGANETKIWTITDSQSETVKPIIVDIASGNLMGFDTIAANDGFVTKRITVSDGGANWAFRAGCYYSGGNLSTTNNDGGAAIIINSEAQHGNITLKTWDRNFGLAGAALTDRAEIYLGASAIFKVGSGSTSVGNFNSNGFMSGNYATDNTANSDVNGSLIAPNGNFAFVRNGSTTGDFNRSDSGTSNLTVFNIRRAGTTVGSCSASSTLTAWNTTSDYRLKENVVPISCAIERLQVLKPSRFNFKTNPDQRLDGFIAHEVAWAVPEAVTGEYDGAEMQELDNSKLVPLLTAALQELVARVEELEAR